MMNEPWTMLRLLTWSIIALVTTTSAGAAHAQASPADRTAREHACGLLIQHGAGLALLGVTEDNYAIYQDATSIYVTPLVLGARRRFIVDVGDKLPFVQIAGKVAFIWTDRPLTNLAGVSPLVVWSAEYGSKFAADASVVATFGAAASADGKQIMFLTRTDPDTLIGDIVVAKTDLSQQRNIATNVAADYTGAICSPFIGFAGRSPSFPVAEYCQAGATTASLSAWPARSAPIRIDNLAAPARWSANTAGNLFITSLASTKQVVSITDRGVIQVLDDMPAYAAFLNKDDSVIAAASADLSQGADLHRITLGPTPHVSTITAITGLYYTNLSNGSGYYSDSPTSKDGKLLLYYDNVDPQFGTTDLKLIDVSQAPSTATTLIADFTATTLGELFTTDSSHALYYVFDPGSGNVALHTASRAGDDREVSDGFSAWNNYAATGSTISYLDHAVIEATGVTPNAVPGLGTVFADLKAVDVAASVLKPVVIAEQVYASYQPAYQRKTVVYSWDRVSGQAGLYLAWVP